MAYEITFGHWLKSRRKLLDLTQQALADRVNCSAETIYKIEAGQRRPSTQIARLLSEKLNVPINEVDTFIRFARSKEPTRLHAHRDEDTPWRDAFIPNNNLPLQLTALLGREQHLADALNRLRQEDVRLLTMVGPPGIGKTRMAIQLGNHVLLDFHDGVYFVELASTSQPDRMIPAIVRTLDISNIGHNKPLESLQKYLYERQVLLILDNFEQILDAAQDIHSLLIACPLLKIVITSRAPLRIRGERLFPIKPLALPSHINELTVHQIPEFPAVQLLIERARDVLPQFALTEGNAASVAAICARLDGLPLAIEIVAAQMSVLQPDEILSNITGKNLLDSIGSEDSDPRHYTLNAAICWSYQLLDANEQTFFRRMSVFINGCTMEAAQLVCQPQNDTMRDIAKLVNMNLLQRVLGANSTSRYKMLETIQAYAHLELQAKSEWTEIQEQHASFFHDFALKHEESVRSNGQVNGLDLVEDDHHNILAALDFFISSQDWERGLALAGALIEFWVYHNHIRIGLSYAVDLLTATANDPSLQEVRATVLNGAAMMSYFAGDFLAIGPYAEESLTSAQAVNSYRGIAWACTNLGMKSGGMGRFDEAKHYFEQGLEATKQANIPWERASILNGFGEIARSQGLFEEAMAYYEQALPIATALGNLWLSAHILDNMGHTTYSQGHYDMANAYVRQSMEASIALGDERGIAMCLEKIGGIAIAKEQFEYASRLLGAAEALRKAKNTPVEGMDTTDYDKFVAALQKQLPPNILEAAWREGQEIPLSQLIEEILNTP